MLTLEFRAMNTAVVLAAEEALGAGSSLEAARRFIEQCERRFSRFLPESELSQLNRSAGEWHRVSPELMDMLVQSLVAHRETGGLFDPAVLPDLKRIGYDRSMDEIRKYGVAGAGHAHPETHSKFSAFEIDAESGWVRLPVGMEIDLGGIAKGWIVERAARLIWATTPACAVSAGGDMLFVGRPADGGSWHVRVEDPWEPAQEVARFEVGPGAIATSSTVKRSWMQAGMRRHHLIDPRTGEPARGDWSSVTVFAPEITTAEVYAKALLIGGEAEASRLLLRRPEISYLIVKSDGGLLSSFEQVESLHEHNSSILK